MPNNSEAITANPPLQNGGSRNRNLQWLRAIAALFVLLYHASVYLKQITGDDTFFHVFDGRFGLLGVAIFFAISGYLMAEILPKADPWRFLLHRILRIYPIFLIVLASVLLARRRPGEVDLWAATLVPAGEGRVYYLGVEWTLLFETCFYVFLFLCSLAGLKNRLSWIASIWLLIIGAATLLYPQIQAELTPTIDWLPLMAVNSAFAFGLLVPALRERGLFQPATAMLAAGLILVCDVFPFGINRWVASVGAFLLVGLVISYNATEAEVNGRLARLADRYGDWSYALYLCHVPLMVAIYLKSPPLPNGVLWMLAILIPLTVAAPFGMLDLFLYKRLKLWADQTSRIVRVSLSGLYTLSFLLLAGWAAWIGVSPHPQAHSRSSTAITVPIPTADKTSPTGQLPPSSQTLAPPPPLP